ncbi:probable serine/threonine protein kinase IRE [Herrania umbratica]|uniref:Probable serine/threonine protein kinase IRE n=1 Tax=Herrania umbratica TaxID=108875 RepID=A0A6J1AHM9_9ROSI|nr:probable serine/threonine protein kinase IRE [Herrania umbratica]
MTKLRKIPPIPIQRSQREPAEKSEGSRSSSDDADEVDDDEVVYQEEEEEEEEDFGSGSYDENVLFKRSMRGDNDSTIILASALGLNHIRTRSNPLPSPLRFSSSAGTPSNLGNVDSNLGRVSNKEKLISGMEACTSHPNHSAINDQEEKVAWSTQSKSLRVPSPLNPGLEVN